MSRIYANENYPSAVVDYLRILGHDVLTTNEADKSNQRIPDEDVLSFAVAEKRAVLTFNRKDFFRLHRLNPAHSGIITCTEDSDFLALAERIHETLSLFHGNLDSQLIRINRPNLNLNL